MLGKKQWLIPDMYWPEITSPGHYVSHEAICVLNADNADANIDITLYFEDAEPVSLEKIVCPAKRTRHFRMDKLAGVPNGAPYAALVTSDQCIAVQYSRLDTTQANNALMTTMAFPIE